MMGVLVRRGAGPIGNYMQPTLLCCGVPLFLLGGGGGSSQLYNLNLNRWTRLPQNLENRGGGGALRASPGPLRGS